MIKVSNLSKSFGELMAVDDLSFEIKKGEIIGFLGPNGAGKTTTMRLMTGFLSPDSGKVSIDNQDLHTHLKTSQQKIGYLPESNPLYEHMLVSDMFTLSADLKGIPTTNRKEAFDFAVKAVSIEEVYYRRIGELSKGYKQRVGMALSLMHKPELIIMDEPTEGLDPNQRTDIRNLIKQLSKDRTIILSTHVMQEALALSTRILIINKGKLVADGTPDQLTQIDKKIMSIDLEIEGNKVLTVLKSLPNIIKIDTISKVSSRYNLKLQINSEKPIQPELTKLAGKNDFVIWSLKEHQNNLEDVFHKLTHK